MSQTPEPSIVVNVKDVEDRSRFHGEGWGGHFRPLTPSMGPRGGALGVNWMRCPPGRAMVPFHAHLREDEVFYVLSGRGVLRYGDSVRDIGPGDCVSCPAGTGEAHQIANPYDEDLIYLAIGNHDPHEVCTYPDTGKVLVRGIRALGQVEAQGYMDGEPDPPKILGMAPDER